MVIKNNFPSITNAYTEAFKVIPEHFTLPGPNGVVTSADWISRWVVITIGMMMFPHITLRFFSGRSLKVLKWSSVFSSIYLTSIYVFTPAIGFIGNILFPNIAAPDTIFPEMLMAYTPIVFAALVISGALAASMSTGDSQLHAVSSMVSTDIYKKHINREADEYKQYWMEYVYLDNINRFAQFAMRVWGVELDLQDPRKTALEGIKRTKEFFNKVGMPTSLAQANISRGRIEEMAEKCTEAGPIGSFKKLYKDDVVKILEMAL
ncbi:sodium:solute symporter family transporter [Schnuerera ultunensis]|uniref:sodium:solute symporter family transporter n=1 Tax=Schnuerera ultunensis TaxID=45497 RepID=UPI0003FC523E|nr:iron-containing alcohol dehydrogenase [Schnuerera ultunensis]